MTPGKLGRAVSEEAGTPPPGSAGWTPWSPSRSRSVRSRPSSASWIIGFMASEPGFTA